MIKSKDRSTGVGSFIRQQVIPQGMSVTEAARRLGVGRPALSNLLNGRAALSQEMALRMEGTFGADRTKLLALQAASDRSRRRVEDRAVAVGTYVPEFLTIKARQITEWAATSIQAREHLPVLLRRLIHSTGRELRHVDFPGYDNAQRHGWDGWVEAGAAAPWVPEGRSGWEFSVEKRPAAKAERDYQARLNKFSRSERAECAFVFVTPHNWEGKARWIRAKEDTGDWRAVKALDASDLEQWLETTIAPRIWLAKQLNVPTEGFETLDHFWGRWAEASEPPMTAKIFAPSIAVHLKAFKEWLETPSDRPFGVAADSREEAVAFLACLLRQEDALADACDHAVVFESASTLRTLAHSSAPFIPIVCNEESEREIATQYRKRHCVVVRPRNAVDREPDVTVELLGHAAFENALADMGIGPERVDRLARESGRSPTVLRRWLSRVPAIGTPSWAGDKVVARRLIPMVLVGAWHCGSKADREVLAALANREYQQVAESIADLLRQDDCPVWSVGQHRGVVSKIDTFFAISQWMTEKDIADFVVVAEYVLSESDPALELPEDKRWAAGLHGKVREHSGALRTGICETLILLAVHGNARFRERLGIDVAACVAMLVKRLLTPLTSDRLQAHDRELPGYAEAAPDEFFALLEEDLARPTPVLRALLRPAGAGVFDSPARTGVLWALERLAWNSRTFPRVVNILARLSQTKIDDNWMNKPINSLSAVFRSWLPQTAAPLDDRIKALETLCRRFPDIGWQICLQQFEGGKQLGSFSNRPRWRNDAADAGRGVTGREGYEFSRKALDLALAWPMHSGATLGDLIMCLGNVPDEDQLSVWGLVDTWLHAETDTQTKADLRERIRRTILTRQGHFLGLKAETRERARQACEKLAPRDPVLRHAWLFAQGWVEISADEASDGNIDWEAQEKRIHELRMAAMAEIWSASGLDGALALLADCEASTIGRYAAGCAVDQQAAADVLRACLAIKADPDGKIDDFMRGFLWSVDENTRPALVSTLVETRSVDQSVRIFNCFPFRSQTWRLLDQQDRCVRDRYWRAVVPGFAQFTESETAEIIDRLLEAGRPLAAFFAVRFDWNKVETSRLRRLLMDVASVRTEPDDHFKVEPYRLSEALDSLGGRPGVTVDEMAQLEFAYIGALDHSEHGIPNLEKKFAESPTLFMRTLALLFRRRGDGQDPPEWRVDDPDRRASLQGAAYRLLQDTKRIPGADADGKVDVHALSRWVVETRRLCAEHDRAVIGDQQIGQLLSRAPSDEDGSWPCRPVCEVLETIASPEIASGFAIGVYNARGVHLRSPDEGGGQERNLAAKYRAWTQRLVFDYPYVARILERVAGGYDRDAEREDVDVLARKRLGY